MAIYNSNANYIRVKFPSGAILPYYIAIANSDLPTGSFNLNSLGQLWFTQHCVKNTAINYMFASGAYLLSTSVPTSYNILSGAKNTMWSSSYTNNSPFGLGEYASMFNSIGLKLDNVFNLRAYQELNLQSGNTSYNTITCDLLDENGNTIDNLYIRGRWESFSVNSNVRMYPQNINAPFSTNDYTSTTNCYALNMQFRLGSTGNWIPNGFLCYNPTRTKIYQVDFSKRDYSSPQSWCSVIDGYIAYTISPLVENVIRYSKIDTLQINEYTSTWTEWLSDNIVSSIKGSTPFSANGEDDFESTSGEYDGSTDSIGVEGLPSDSILSSGMLKAYVIDGADLASLHSYMFSSTYTQALENIFNAPIDAVVKLHQIPVTPTSYADNITLGNVDTGISSYRTTAKFVEVDLGNISLSPYYGLFADYETTIELYLPFVGMVQLNIDDANNGIINVKYRFDILTGDFVALVFCTNTNAKGYGYTSLIHICGGNVSGNIPLTSGGFDIGNLVGSLANTIGATALNPASAIGVGISSIRNTIIPQVSYSGGMNGWSSFLGKRTPYIRLTIPNYKLPGDYAKLHGFKSGYNGLVGNFSGYLTVQDCIVDIGDKTDNDRIKDLLRSGVFVENNNYTPVTTTNSISLLNNLSDDRVIDKNITLVSTITGQFKDILPLEQLEIKVESDITTINSVNYIYIADLDRYYFIRQKSAINSSIFSLVLDLDYLQTFKDTIKNISVISGRSESMYNAMLGDSDIPKQLNNIVRYLEFPTGLTSDSTILVCV